jgi:hypothetical protein
MRLDGGISAAETSLPGGALFGDVTANNGGVAFDTALADASRSQDAATPVNAPSTEQRDGWSFSDIGHTVLDIAGMVPVIGEVADGVNAIWYAGEGRWGDAALSAAGMIPLAGNVSTGVRLGRHAVDAVDMAGDAMRLAGRHGDEVIDAGRTIARHGDEVADLGTGVVRQGDEMVGTLRGVRHRLPGWEMQPLDYVKRTPEDLADLRRQFNSSGRRDFVQHIAANNAEELRAAGLTQTQIDRLASGRIPSGYQVHHILPLDDGGTNAFSNLVLIRNHPDHKIITNLQNELTQGMRPGEVRQIQWPVPSEPTIVYPNGAGTGAVPLN